MAKKAAKKSSVKKSAKKLSVKKTVKKSPGEDKLPAKGKEDPLAKMRAERLEKVTQQRAERGKAVQNITVNTHRNNLDEQRAKRKSDNKKITGGKYANIETTNEVDVNSHSELSKKIKEKDFPEFLKGHLMKPKKNPNEASELAFLHKHSIKPKTKMHTKK